MPELPDVEGQRQSLARSLPGRMVVDVAVADARVLRNATPAEFETRIVGCRFGSPRRHGKWLYLATDGPLLAWHNGMTGQLHFADRDSLGPVSAPASASDRLIIGIEGGLLRFTDRRALGGLWITDPDADLAEITGAQGPDALGLALPMFQALLRARRGTVKSTLMQQSVIAGLGNMLSDEICWRAHVHPARTVASLSDREVRQLHRALRFATRTAAAHGAIPRTSRWLSSTRDRDPAACPRCRTELRRSRLNGRTAIWCPRCQPEP